MNNTNLFRQSDYFDILERNLKRPTIIKNIKGKLRETFAILASRPNMFGKIK